MNYVHYIFILGIFKCQWIMMSFQNFNRELYAVALENDASCVEALYNLGLCNKKLGMYDDALEVFFKLHNILRNHSQVRYKFFIKLKMNHYQIWFVTQCIILCFSDNIWLRFFTKLPIFMSSWVTLIKQSNGIYSYWGWPPQILLSCRRWARCLITKEINNKHINTILIRIDTFRRI